MRLRVELLSKIGDFSNFTRKSCLGGCLVKTFVANITDGLVLLLSDILYLLNK